jgi:hypothetical protein
VLESYSERQNSEKMNPAMRYCKGAPDADQTKANNGRKTNVLTCHNSSRRNPLGKEESQQKGIVDIRGSESCNARRQHRQVLIPKESHLSLPRAAWQYEASAKAAPAPSMSSTSLVNGRERC